MGGSLRLLLVAALGGILLLSGPLAAFGDDLSDERARLAVIGRLQQDLETNLQRAEAQEIALEQQLQATRDTIRQTLEQIAATERRIAELEAQIAALQARIADARVQLARAKADYGAFVRSTYKAQADILPLLLKAPDFQAFLNRAASIQRLTTVGEQLLERIRRIEHELRLEEEQARLRKQEADARRADLLSQHAALEREQAKEQDLLYRLERSIAHVRSELVLIKDQSAAVAQRIVEIEIARQNRIIAEAEEAAWQQAQFWMAHNLFSLPEAGGQHSTKYPLIWPLPKGERTLLFGPTTLWYEPPAFGYRHFHTGIDIASTQGSPILAADDGVVVAADQSTLGGVSVGYGTYVIVAHHANYLSLYGHLLRFQVKPGDQLHQGQVIGFEGSTGNSTGPHLHFEFRYNGQPTNPLPFLPPNGPSAFNQ